MTWQIALRNQQSNPAHEVRRLLKIVLRSPGEVAKLSCDDLDLALRITRRAQLLGRLAEDLRDADLLDTLPTDVTDQLLSFHVMADSRARLALWELDRIAWALRDENDIPLILLKGCAYLILGLPNARGRIFADVDILTTESELERVEGLLNERGWQSRQLTPYDQNYYRKWTHELPPLIHVEREVEIDLHHNVLPRTARLKPDANKLIAQVNSLTESRFGVLADVDIVLHAMTHLMFDGDLADDFRGLVDIDELLNHFASQNRQFWENLVSRAEDLNLERPAFYGLRYARRLLNCPVPPAVIADSRKWGPPRCVVWIMDRLVPRAIFPPHPDHPSKFTNFSRWLLFVRSHWIRMPPWLLTYHLSNKFFATRLWNRKYRTEH